ncbi:unnamed protein product, partial [Choristocarpus tenellus]
SFATIEAWSASGNAEATSARKVVDPKCVKPEVAGLSRPRSISPDSVKLLSHNMSLDIAPAAHTSCDLPPQSPLQKSLLSSLQIQEQQNKQHGDLHVVHGLLAQRSCSPSNTTTDT